MLLYDFIDFFNVISLSSLDSLTVFLATPINYKYVFLIGEVTELNFSNFDLLLFFIFFYLNLFLIRPISTSRL